MSRSIHAVATAATICRFVSKSNDCRARGAGGPHLAHVASGSKTYATERTIVRGRVRRRNNGMSILSRTSVASLAIALLVGAGYFGVSAERLPEAAAAPEPHPQSATTAATPAAAPSPRALVDRYCVTCHNERLKTGGLSLDVADIEHPSMASEVWEKVAHKLRAGDMPPAGRPRPEPAVSMGLASYLEGESRQSGGRDPHRRPRDAASAEPDGIHERRPRLARSGDPGVALTHRERDRWLRQYCGGADGLADAARAIHVARQTGESPRRW